MGNIQQILAPIVRLGKEENLTKDEMGMIDTFSKVYFVALANKKGVTDVDAFVKVMKDNFENTLNISMSFKYLRYPNREMERENFIQHTTSVLVQKFGVKEVEKALDTMQKIF